MHLGVGESGWLRLRVGGCPRCALAHAGAPLALLFELRALPGHTSGALASSRGLRQRGLIGWCGSESLGRYAPSHGGMENQRRRLRGGGGSSASPGALGGGGRHMCRCRRSRPTSATCILRSRCHCARSGECWVACQPCCPCRRIPRRTRCSQRSLCKRLASSWCRSSPLCGKPRNARFRNASSHDAPPPTNARTHPLNPTTRLTAHKW